MLQGLAQGSGVRIMRINPVIMMKQAIILIAAMAAILLANSWF
jgi:hypothetical protein